MKLVEKDNISYLKPLYEDDNMLCVFLTKSLSISPIEGGGIKRPVVNHESIVRLSSQFPANRGVFIFMNQIHSDGIVIKSDYKPNHPTADAMITPTKGVTLCIKTADCLPLFIYDPVNKVVAAIHAGWRGTALRLAKKLLKRIVHEFKSDTQTLRAFLGPCISQPHYEVGEEVFDAHSFLGRARSDFFYKNRGGRYQMDLQGINRFLLLNEGIPEENIESSDICTHCEDKLFHSYRRDKEGAGRNISFIRIR